MRNLAIILARGGSKRIPGKNIKIFNGKPLLSYSIRTALESNLFEEVMVSTDSEEIAQIAMAHGAQVPFMRSDETATDNATTLDALKEVAESYKKKDVTFDNFCCLYPASVMIGVNDLTKSFSAFCNLDKDFLASVLAYHHPIQRAMRLDAGMGLRMIQPANANIKSQDLEKHYHDAGQFYWGKFTALKTTTSFWEARVGSYVLDPIKAQDIDTQEDWQIAEFKFEWLHKQGVV